MAASMITAGGRRGMRVTGGWSRRRLSVRLVLPWSRNLTGRLRLRFRGFLSRGLLTGLCLFRCSPLGPYRGLLERFGISVDSKYHQ